MIEQHTKNWDRFTTPNRGESVEYRGEPLVARCGRCKEETCDCGTVRRVPRQSNTNLFCAGSDLFFPPLVIA